MKLIVTEEKTHIRFDGELILSPKPAPNNLYIGTTEPTPEQQASVMIIHLENFTHKAYLQSANVVGPPKNIKELCKLVWAIGRWLWHNYKNRSAYSKRISWTQYHKIIK